MSTLELINDFQDVARVVVYTCSPEKAADPNFCQWQRDTVRNNSGNAKIDVIFQHDPSAQQAIVGLLDPMYITRIEAHSAHVPDVYNDHRIDYVSQNLRISAMKLSRIFGGLPVHPIITLPPSFGEGDYRPPRPLAPIPGAQSSDVEDNIPF